MRAAAWLAALLLATYSAWASAATVEEQIAEVQRLLNALVAAQQASANGTQVCKAIKDGHCAEQLGERQHDTQSNHGFNIE